MAGRRVQQKEKRGEWQRFGWKGVRHGGAGKEGDGGGQERGGALGEGHTERTSRRFSYTTSDTSLAVPDTDLCLSINAPPST
jgi:hypothetical protein